MKYLKKIGIALAYVIGITLSLLLFITIFSYFNIINEKTTNIFLLISSIIAIFVGGLIIGKNSNKKGWLEGLKLSIIIIILYLLFSFLGLNYHFKISNFIYYLILVISSSLGSMIGINKKSQM